MTNRKRSQSVAPVITASEIGEYAYCAKAWQLRRAGVAPRGAQLDEGTAFHQQHGATTAQAAQLEHAGRRLVGLAIFLLCLLGLYLLLTGGAAR